MKNAIQSREEAMLIMTARGWMLLWPGDVISPPPDTSRYRGKLPSPNIQEFIRRLEIEVTKQRASRLQIHTMAA